jgi:hypothetical protein
MRLVPVLGAAALTLALSGCSLLGFGGDDAKPEPKTTHADSGGRGGQGAQGTSNRSPGTRTRSRRRRSSSPPCSTPVTSPNSSKPHSTPRHLGNDVPSKMFGVKTDKGCVVGEIRVGEGDGRTHGAHRVDGFLPVRRGRQARRGSRLRRGRSGTKTVTPTAPGHLPGEDINGDDGPTSRQRDSAAERGIDRISGLRTAVPPLGPAEGSDDEAPSLGSAALS